jgi:hypothetical protein
MLEQALLLNNPLLFLFMLYYIFHGGIIMSLKVQPVMRTSFNMNKDREKQNEERRKALLLKKAIIEEKKRQLEKLEKNRIDIRI